MDDYDDSDVGLAPEEKKYAKSGNLDWFKGEKGFNYRASIVYFNSLDTSIIKAMQAKARKDGKALDKDAVRAKIKEVLAKRAEELSKPVDALAEHEKLDITNVRFKRLEAYYKEGVGYALSRLGKDGPEADAIWNQLGDVKVYFTTLLLMYRCSRDGEMLKGQEGQFDLIPWRFGAKVYETLHKRSASLRDNKLSIASQDLMLTCGNREFQHFDVDGCGPSIWQKDRKAGFANVLAKALPLYSKLVPFREMSTSDLRIKLGISSGDSSSDQGVGSDEDITNIIDSM